MVVLVVLKKLGVGMAELVVVMLGFFLVMQAV